MIAAQQYIIKILLPFTLLLLVSCSQNNASHHFKNGNAKYKLGDYRGAMNDYSKSIQINNRMTEAYYLRALCASKLNLYDKALQDYNKVLELEPNNLNALFNRAFYIKESTGDFAGAAEDYARYISLNIDGNNAFAYNNMGFAKYKTGRVSEGLSDIDKSIEINPENPYAFRNKGIILFENDSLEAACMNLKRAMDLGYKNEADTLANFVFIKYCK